ncbi:MAG: adenylate/guanylate cyclase domain-containing protein [Bacteroidota bacterium]
MRFFCIGWTLAFVFLGIVRGVGTQELGELQFSFSASMLMAFSLGPIMGLVAGTFRIIIEERIYQYISLRRLLLIQLVYIVLLLILLTLSAYLIYHLYFGIDQGFWQFVSDRGSGAIYFFILVTDFALSLVRQVSMMLGEGNLSKLLMGKFYSPREEHRIFMFLDLQSSTTIAEKLGHIRYSKLIQDCFNDLGIVVNYQAEIYQYVGDEAVLTWPLQQGLEEQHCLSAFFSFKELLQQNSAQYLKKYGCQPIFKAGVHAGLVTVTEVGRFKKEIAYHGDVLNTAARIQSQCNTLGQELLISKSLKDQLSHKDYSFEPQGNIPLKGKQETVAIDAVTIKPKLQEPIR